MDILPKRPFELVAIANDNCLTPRVFIQYAVDLAFSLAGENVRTEIDPRDPLDRRRTRRLYIDPEGQITQIGNPFIQKVRLGFFDKDGNSHRFASQFPEKLYLRFINLKSEEALDLFIQRTGFCVFPTISETEQLFREYQEEGIKTPRIFLPRRDRVEIRNRDLMKIVNINKRFIMKKKNELASYVEQYREGTLRYDQLLWLNRQLENISNVLIDGKHFIWNEIRESVKGEVAEDLRTQEELIGLTEIRKLDIIPIIRVYGHFAYCCYEFFLDILEKNHVLVCRHCAHYFHPNRKGQFLCKEPSCMKARNSRLKTGK